MLIRVKVQAKSSREELEEIAEGEYKAWVTAPPADGEANAALIELLAEHFNVAPSLIKIKSGNKSAHKLVEIDMDEALTEDDEELDDDEF
jgi:uncharacterized protein (TIGR00251 family)